MELSIFLAKVIGLYFLLLVPFYLYRKDIVDRIFDGFYSNPGLVVVTGIFTLILGLLIVVSHSVWEWNYKLIITLVGYIAVVKGLLNIYAPEWGLGVTKRFLENKSLFIYPVILSLVVGLYLTYVGFSA